MTNNEKEAIDTLEDALASIAYFEEQLAIQKKRAFEAQQTLNYEAELAYCRFEVQK